MKLTFLAASILAAVPTMVQAVGINSFDGQSCAGFEEHYNLNPGGKGNFPGGRKSFFITQAQAGCHFKAYTGANQQPTNTNALSFKTDDANAALRITVNPTRTVLTYTTIAVDSTISSRQLDKPIE
ncbi:MAG: hypothetical protein Q9190_006090 [Brigantiaea leucoxantha]